MRYECKTSDLTKTKAWEKYNNMTESEKADTYRVDNNVVDMDYINSAEYRKNLILFPIIQSLIIRYILWQNRFFSTEVARILKTCI